MKMLLNLFIFYSISAFAIRDNFKMIDGKNYYQILDVAEDADAETIKKSYRQLMKKYHTDIGGDKAFAQNLNEANDTLKNPETRKRYNQWLGGDSPTERQKVSEDELRKQQRTTVLEAVAEAIEKNKEKNPHLSIDQMARIAESYILHHVRYFPMANLTNNDLFRLIQDFSLNRELILSRQYSERVLIALGGAAIRLLQERASTGSRTSYGEYAQRILNNLEHQLQEWMRNRQTHQGDYSRYADEIWKLAHDGKSYLQSCEPHLRATFTDQHGNTYEIPITIEVKIGR